jgi:hypothetical protein
MKWNRVSAKQARTEGREGRRRAVETRILTEKTGACHPVEYGV